jgi:hypothetical protein
MPSSKRRETPQMVRNCVDSVARKLAEKHSGPVTRDDVSRAFAICISAGRKSGQLTTEGPLRHTKRGAAMAKRHKAKSTPERKERYEEMLGSVRKTKRKAENPAKKDASAYSFEDLVDASVRYLSYQKINDIEKARDIARKAMSAKSPLGFIAISARNLSIDMNRKKSSEAKRAEVLSKKQIEAGSARIADENSRRLVRDVSLQVSSSYPRQATNIEAFLRVHVYAAYGDQSEATRAYAEENAIKINAAEQRVHRGALAVMKYGGNSVVSAWISARRGAKRVDTKINPHRSRHEMDRALAVRKVILGKVREAVRDHVNVVRNACQSGNPKNYADEQKVSLERILYEVEMGMATYCDMLDD